MSFKVSETVIVEGAQEQPVENAQEQQATQPERFQVAETVVVEQPTAQPVQQPQEPIVEQKPVESNYSWLEKFNIKSEQDIENIINQKKTFEQQVQELQNRPTYKTEFAKVADELASKGVKPETIARFHGLKANELDDSQAILTKLEIEFPNLTPSEREAYFNETYGGINDEDSLLTEGQRAAKKVQLQKEATSAREFLQQYTYEALNPNQIDPAILAKEEQRQSFWKSEGLTKLNAPNEIKFQATVKLPENGSVVEKQNDFVYHIEDADKQALLKEFNETVVNPSFAGLFDNSENGVKTAQTVYDQMLWGKLGPKILKAQIEHNNKAVGLVHEHYAKMLNNTSFKGVSTDVSSDKSVSADKGAAQFLSRFR